MPEKLWLLGKKSMKKKMMLFTIVLTLCLAASAFAAAPKSTPAPSRPMTDEEASKDPLHRKQWRVYVDCMQDLVPPLAFNYATSSSLFTAVRAKAEKCRAYLRMSTLRFCELTTDPKTGPVPTSACSGGKYLEKELDNMLDTNTLDAIKVFDMVRADKGLPPRPSFDK